MPISFTCPHCGNQTEVADQYAGQSGPCASCGKTVTVPSAPGTGTFPPPASSAGGLSVLVIVLAAFGIGTLLVIGILVALLLPAIQAARESARRAQCANNLKQLSIAFMTYNDVNGRLPPACTVDEQGRPMHSWRVLILPYLGQQALFDQYRMNEPWNGPNNSRLTNQMPAIFRCPSDDEGTSITSYMAIVGENTPMRAGTSMSFNQIAVADGNDNTLLIIEADGRTSNWMAPQDIPLDNLSRIVAAGELSSPHTVGANVMFCDGAVRILRSDDVSPETIEGMATATGGEMVPSW